MNKALFKMAQSPGEWLNADGPESEVIISTRIRLARNVHDTPFVNHLNQRGREKLFNNLRESLNQAKLVKDGQFFAMEEIDPIDRQFLVERHLISSHLTQQTQFSGVYIANNDRLSIMVNEEDHLRLQVLASGFQVENAWAELDKFDSQLETHVHYAFSKTFGYLSACPTNTGTGMRVSLMLHLPALTMSGKIQKVIDAISNVGLTIRGFFGEGSKTLGHFYQISNQITLGMKESSLAGDLNSTIPQISRYEKEARKAMLKKENRLKLEDKIWRDLGLLKSARILSSEETLNALSSIRMGVYMELVKGVKIEDLNRLLVYSQPAHLQRWHGESLGPQERDSYRADYIRNSLAHIDLV